MNRVIPFRVIQEIVRQHDKEFPDHAMGACDCHNGMIAAYYALYPAPPYVPPIRIYRPGTNVPVQQGRLTGIYGKPWMKRRKGESQRDFDSRLEHSCYMCGHYEPDMHVLADHEDTAHHQRS